MKKWRRWIRKNIYILIGVPAAVVLAGGFLYISYLSLELPDLEQIANRRISQSTKIYDRTGEVLLFEIHGEEKRTVIDFDEIPDIVKQATIAAEDRNFYTHHAFDWQALLRSIWIDVFYGKRVGGSTITQQLAKNVFLSPDKLITRKIKELMIAFKLENKFSKDEILGLYLNQIPYGGNAYGIEAAAQTYFNKPARELTLAEASILVALPQAPTYYSPYGNHIDALKDRQNYVLSQMVELGYINENKKEEALAGELSYAPQTTSIKAPHFVMMVIDRLRDMYGEDMIQTGGLRVVTTLDWELQQTAERVIFEGAERNWEKYKGRNAALVAQEAETGQILSLVGSFNYFDTENEGNFNVAYQGLRQPGSAFKPFAYVTAFEKGYTPETVLFDVKTEFDTTGGPEDSYSPHNFDNKYRGPISIRNSLAQSVNVTAVKALYLAGIDETLETAAALGINTLTDRSQYGLSLVLGGGEVRLTELVDAYSVFAQDGIKHNQEIILEVKNSEGETLHIYKDEPNRVIEAQPVRLINDVLSDVGARSGLFSSSLSLTIFNDYQVALKTGTTNDYVDAWTVGYTPQLVVGVWAGNNRREPMQQQGSSLLAALPIWNDFFGEAIKKYEPGTFIRPETDIVEKPILKGDYKFGRMIHNILYYVDKDDPRGPVPSRPENDPQFEGWEEPVIEWAEENIEDFEDEYNKSDEYNYRGGEQAEVEIDIYRPGNGDFIERGDKVEADIKSKEEIEKVELYLNGQKINEKRGDLGKTYIYRSEIRGGRLNLQNELKIKVETRQGEAEKVIVVFGE